jgi:ABC-type uncharacterized transport system permease subunit
MDFGNFIVNPVTLMIIVFGLIEFIKQTGVEGNKLRYISIGLGILLGVVYQLRSVFLAAQVWIDIVFFGIAVGLAASGIFTFLNNRFPAKPPETLVGNGKVEDNTPVG